MTLDLILMAILAIAALLVVAAGIGVPAKGEPRPRLGVALVLVTPLLAAGLYAMTGRAGMPDQPIGPRLAMLEQRPVVELSEPELLVRLESIAHANPKDPAPHVFIAQLLQSAGREEQAVFALKAALRRAPDDGELVINLARAMVRADGQVTTASKALFARASTLLPDHPIPYFYQALEASRSEDWVGAQTLWQQTLARLPKDDARRVMAAKMLRDAREKATGMVASKTER